MATQVEPAAAEHDSPPRPVTDLGWMLAHASHAFGTRLTAALEDVGISPRAFCLLKTAMTGEFTQTELAKAVDLDKTTMVVTVDELEEAGLAKRLPSAEDRRVRVIAVTKAGERKVEKAKEIVRQVEHEVLSALPAGERRAFLAALMKLLDGPLDTPAQCVNPVRRRSLRS